MSRTVKFASGRTVTFRSSGRKKKGSRKYSPAARKLMAQRMRDFNAKRMRSSSGQLVKKPEQAAAIAFSEAREKGLKVPAKRERLIG